MRPVRFFAAWLLAVLVLSGSGPALATQPAQGASGRPPAVAELRAPQQYVCGDSIFGPVELSSRPPFDRLFTGYERPTDEVRCRDFLETWGYVDEQGRKRWTYPDNNGFEGEPRRLAVEPGTLLDRFGNSTGGFLAPAGALYRERSLPPTNLNTPTGGPQHNYHVYEVLQPFDVDAGPAAAWFGQPGGGLQYWLNPDYKPTGDLAPYNVDYLLANGFVREVQPK
ncbi:TNT domain-containing protein [Saccharopolyspora erythraea]|uniref:TNT domain-containing protein n=1 Tax=Saccharopolyspora erythraea TaxID=1836 RepID=UPI001BA90462|nr:TNT domain-containing protein [Saccharopolyspora erythraea]QUH03497.1 TNT domain-containing protein [Saccharopolyspora erythraea]